MPTNLSISIKDFNDFKSACNYFGIEINNNQLELFKKYYEILLDWNEKINLISRKEQNILEKHFLDSVLFLPEIEKLPIRHLTFDIRHFLDIGSGGGFPGIPLAIMKPEWKFTLCESIKKKTNFLEHLVKELNLTNVEIIHARVETLHVAHKVSEPRPQSGRATSQKYDFVTARAVARLDVLIKYALPLLKKGGYLLAYKSKDIDDEIKNVTLPLQILSKEINGVERKLVVLSYPGIL